MDIKINGRNHRQGTHSGFTLVELLVIVATIVVLGSLELMALASARQQTERVTCLNNMRQLSAAWRLYSSNNGGRFVPNPIGPTVKSWVYGNMSTDADRTNLDYLTNSRYAMMGPYVKNPNIFKCPLDLTCNSKGYPSVRSVSMNAAVGPMADGSIATKNSIISSGDPSYKIFVRESDLSYKSPDTLWVQIEEYPPAVNDGFFAVNVSPSPTLLDVPSLSHDTGFALSFADGHSMIRKLSSVRFDIGTVSLSRTDIEWLRSKTTVKF